MLAALTMVGSTACSTAGYLAHVSVGQIRLLLDRETLDDELIARLSAEERAGLVAVRGALEHAEALGLTPSSSYRTLIDRDGEPLVTLVVAAPPDRVEAVTWWFPIVGSVPYRGYFDPARAQSFADDLGAQGLDTYVRPALLYSTLGWFDDPLPRAMLRMDPVLLHDTIVHERVHETIFVPSDVPYNEGLATFVAHQATLESLSGNADRQERARRLFADEARFAALVARLAEELEALYAGTETPQGAQRDREAIFERYRTAELDAVPWETPRYEWFRDAPLNNAWLVAQRTYLGDLPCFERELVELDGDLRAFIAQHREHPGRRPGAGDCLDTAER